MASEFRRRYVPNALAGMPCRKNPAVVEARPGRDGIPLTEAVKGSIE
jgi:hypothetical protein